MRYRRADGVLHQEVDGVVVLITAAGDELLDLNPSGSVVWRALGDVDGADRATLVDAVVAAFPDAPTDVVATDVEAFLAGLVGDGLVTSE